MLFTVPMVGEFSDVIWAPIAAYLMTRMYIRNGRKGGVVTFLEEIFPSQILSLYANVYNYIIKRERELGLFIA
jgi:hypothetical protein